jgi:hypothetical protein
MKMYNPQNTLNEDWQYLIIFDACRYDYFEKNYQKHLKGKLEPRKSPAIYTPEWLEKTFIEYYDDIIYISPVFFCNSVRRRSDCDFFGKEHFFKVVNAWRDNWDEEYGTVPPWSINQLARKYAMKYPNKRIVIHYFQPHTPYLSIKTKIKVKKKKERQLAINKGGITIKTSLTRKVSAIYHRTFGTESLWKMIERFNLGPYTNQEEAYRIVGLEGVKKAYNSNVNSVMLSVKELLPHLPPGKVVITADHGELLGEKKFWGHGPPKPRLPELTTIPWFEVIQ